MRRLYLSLYGGIAFPVTYSLLLLVIDSVFGTSLGEPAREWLLLPIAWSTKAIASLYHPQSVGEIFGAVADLFVLTLLVNFVLYSLLTYFGLWLYSRISSDRRHMSEPSPNA